MFYWQFERHFYMRVIVFIIPTNFYLYSFVFFSLKPKTRINFSASWWSGNKRYSWLLFIASRASLQRHAEFNSLLQRNFLTCVIPVRIIVSWYVSFPLLGISTPPLPFASLNLAFSFHVTLVLCIIKLDACVVTFNWGKGIISKKVEVWLIAQKLIKGSISAFIFKQCSYRYNWY